nr:septal ring lytic transglycosylase RlpA family protein [Afifella sp. IM 167]
MALSGLSAGCVSTEQQQAGMSLGLAESPGASAAADEAPDETVLASLRAGAVRKLGKAYKVAGRVYKPRHNDAYAATGLASWYGDAFDGKLTANGEIFDMAMLTAAHPTLPLPSYVRVTNLDNDRSVIVRVNDRGPFHSNRLIDVSKRAADMLDFKHAGTANVKVEYVDQAPLQKDDREFLLASYHGPELPSGPDPADAAANMMVAYAAEAPTTDAKEVAEGFGEAVDPTELAAGTPFDPYSALAAGTELASAGMEATPAPQAASFVLPQPAPARPALRSSYLPEARIDDAFAALDAVMGQGG